ALALTMVWPIETCPSPPITTEPPLRTVRIVVACQLSDSGLVIMEARVAGDLDIRRARCNQRHAVAPCAGVAAARMCHHLVPGRTLFADWTVSRDDGSLRLLAIAHHLDAHRRALDRPGRRPDGRRRDLLARATPAREPRRGGLRWGFPARRRRNAV